MPVKDTIHRTHGPHSNPGKMQHTSAISNGFMAKSSENRMMPDMRDFTEPSISLLETEEDHRTHTTKETADINPTADTRTTIEEDKTTEIEDASPLPKAETTWTLMP